jgi:hypothetical protein
MYLDEPPRIHIADILIGNAVLSYDLWLNLFFPEERQLVPSEISFDVPEIWPLGTQHKGDAPEWAKQKYSRTDLRRPINPSVIQALRSIVKESDKEFEGGVGQLVEK